MNTQFEADKYRTPDQGSDSTAPNVRPSRLINLHKHEADLASPTTAPTPETPMQGNAPTTPSAPIPTSAPTSLTAPNPPIPVDHDLAMNIAADYTAATLNASTTDLPARIGERDELSAAIYNAQNSTTIDEIARTASEAIAAIRSTTDPDDVARQIAALKRFASHLRENPSMPEIIELSDTIEKFISVAEKSTTISSTKAIASKSTKTEKTVPVKLPEPTVKQSATVAPAPKAPAHKIEISKASSQTPTKPAEKTTEKKSLKTAKQPIISIPKPAAKASTATKKSNKALSGDDTALRQALRSVTNMDGEDMDEPVHKTRRKGSGKHFALAFCCTLACITGIIYFVSTNIPDVSIRVAAMQTGIEASYPAYIPRNFSLKDISSEDSKITLTFEGPENAKFTLVEEKCAWDSAALQRNFVEPNWPDDYTTTHEQGITIYMYSSNAAWVNGGVRYTISAEDGVLTKKQLRNIVTSM